MPVINNMDGMTNCVFLSIRARIDGQAVIDSDAILQQISQKGITACWPT